jgi:transmembrane protein EpsG
MTVYVFLIVLCVFFSWLQQIGALKNGLKLSFFLVFLFLAMRHDYGNDYSGYYNGFLALQSLQDEDFYFKGNEFGWLYLNYFFKYLFGDIGFHVMLASMAGFTCFVLYRFITKYIPLKYYTFGVALLLLEPNNILVLSSGMRQSIAVGIFLLSFDFLVQKKYFFYLIGILLASLFHSSALVFITLILLNIFNWKIYLPYVFLFITALFVLTNNLAVIFDQINTFLESQESVYSVYTTQGYEEVSFGFGFALIVILYLSILIINRKNENAVQNTIVKVAIVALLLLVLSLSVQLATRLNFYIFPLIVCGYALMLSKLGKLKIATSPIITRLATFLIIAFFAYQNYGFWQSEVYSPYFFEYKTIFQSPLLK